MSLKPRIALISITGFLSFRNLAYPPQKVKIQIPLSSVVSRSDLPSPPAIRQGERKR
jgi:hypothetical protein